MCIKRKSSRRQGQCGGKEPHRCINLDKNLEFCSTGKPLMDLKGRTKSYYLHFTRWVENGVQQTTLITL